MQLALPIPDYSTVSRRQGALHVPVAALPQRSPRHIVIDATGLRVYGAGEWRVWKHRIGRRRMWRKLHLGIDETTKEIVAVELTGSRVHDSQPLPALLDQIADPIGQVSGDGAYDTRTCYEAVLQREATPTFVPRRTARPALTRIPPNGVLRAIVFCGRSKPGDARRGRCSVGTHGRVSPRIRCSDSSSCSGDGSGRGGTSRNARKRR